LIQRDDFSPSFRMYHYLQPGDDNPVFGLGEKTWKLEGVERKDDLHQATFSTTVPEMDDIKIIKTYRLQPKDYHVTLLLEFRDERDAKAPDAKARSLRYQLTGGHGLPIEGEWYTSTFRNAYTGLLERNGRFYRKLEDSARISGHRGGEKYPDRTSADNFIQFA